MGLNVFRFLATSFVALILTPFANAAPMLRLVSTTVGPASIAVGSNGPTQTVEAYNAGNGTLSLTASFPSSVSWATATVGASRACTTTYLAATCIPISVAFNTSALPTGTQTAILTVNGASGTVDAPQTITVTVAMGGSMPSSIGVYVPPNGSASVYTPTNSDLRWSAATKDGNNWLSMAAISSGGSFKFVYPWYVQIAAQPANTAGAYTGTLTVSGSSFAGDNKTIPVTMNVTTQPIVSGPSAVNVTLAQGAPPLAPPYTAVGVTLANLGQGTLSVTGVTPTIASCGSSWLTVAQTSTGANLTIDPTGLAIGTCSASLAFTTNAVNTLAAIPVTLTVEAKGPPSINYQGVLDNATFVPGDTVSQGDIVVVKGDQLSFAGSTTGGYTAGPAPPLATTVGGASILVNGEAAPLFYSLYNQLAFQMPVDTAVGTATVQVTRDDGTSSNLASVTVAAKAPKILILSGSYGAVVNATDSTSTTLAFPFPVGAIPGLTSRPATAGDTLVIYAIGLGATSPAVGTGQPAPSTAPLATLVSTPSVAFSSGAVLVNPVTAVPSFYGLTPTYAGLYQLNVTVPTGCPTGTVYMFLVFPDGTVSNTVQIAVQ